MDAITIRQAKNGYIVTPENDLSKSRTGKHEVSVFSEFDRLVGYLKEVLIDKAEKHGQK